jgi:hypothetical protein
MKGYWLAGADPAVTYVAQTPPPRPVAVNDFAPSARQAALVAAICTITSALAWVGQGSAAKLLFITLAVAAAAWYHRHSPWLYLTLLCWFWTLTPFVRRVIDYRIGFDPTDIILGTPNLISVFILPDVLKSRKLWRRPETLLVLMLFVPALYGLMVNFALGNVGAGVVGAADWLVPLLYLFFLIHKADTVNEAEPHLRGFVTLNSLVVAGYGLYQFWYPPAWDVQWVLSSRMIVGEHNDSGTFLVFSTLNSRGPFAQWLAVLILLSLHFRTRCTPLLVPALVFLLLQSWVRSVTVGVVLGLAIALLLGGGRMVGSLFRIGAAVIGIAVILVNVNTGVVDSLASRFATLQALKYDDSAIARERLWAKAPDLIDDHPFGIGIGALGRGAVYSNDPDLVSVDAGPIAIYLSLGWFAGTIYLLGMLSVVGKALSVAVRQKAPAVIAFAAAATCSFAELPFVNILGFAGVGLWLCTGFAIAYAIRARLMPGARVEGRRRCRNATSLREFYK